MSGNHLLFIHEIICIPKRTGLLTTENSWPYTQWSKRFRHMLEGREFVIYTDQKPLMYAFQQKADKCSPRQLRHLDFISQFSTNIQHVPGTRNLVADALSRIEIDSISQASCLDYKDIAAAQLVDEELKQLLKPTQHL
ncbi:transposon Tf2-6 polyprotein [Trichonephila clavipes]|nr:transposon Tf2-6 polyprotein [Trichonephila clavipes]